MAESKKSELKNLRQYFVSRFVNELIRHCYNPEMPEVLEIKKEEIQKPGKILIGRQGYEKSIMKPLAYTKERLLFPVQKPKRMPVLPSPAGVVSSARESGAINLGKIASILMDPAVLSVECPGPEKNLVINRSGAIQTSSIALTKEEIYNIMNEISKRTRIPITRGVFKIALQDLLVTALISELVGTRFIIRKKTPFQNMR